MSKLKDDASYCVGMSVGYSLANQDLDTINIDEFLTGLKAVFSKEETRIQPQQANQVIQSFLEEVNESKYAVNKHAGVDFLKTNASKQGIQTTASGLQYEVILEGSGNKPAPTSKVTVHYHGTLIDGTVFDSSIQRNQPATFGVNQVIAGWTEALQLMNKGAKYRLYIPEELAYGANPHPGGPIQPYMALIFDVELIDIN